MEPILGEIRIFAGNFAPRGWAFCYGQLMAISSNTALFSILGTYYGGDGIRTFGLPDLRGRGPLSTGTSATSGTVYDLGEVAGVESVTLISTEMPVHNHNINVVSPGGSADVSTPVNNYSTSISATIGGDAAAVSEYAAAVNDYAAPTSIGLAGSTLPHNNLQPFLAINYIVALEGIYPARN